MHKWLWTYIQKYIPLLVIGILLLCAERIAIIIVYGTQLYIVDDVMAKSNYGLLPRIILVFAIFQLVWIFSKIISTHVLIHVQVRLENALCRNLFKSMHRKTVMELQEKRTGEVYTLFSDDVTKLSAFLSQDVPKGIQKIIAMIVLVAATVWINPLLFGFVTVFTIVYMMIGKLLSVQSNQAAKSIQVKRTLMMSDIEENVVSVRDVIANHKEKWIMNKFLKTFQAYYDAVMSEGKVANKMIGFGNAMRWGMSIGVLAIGGYMVMKGQTTLGSFVVVYHFSSQLMQAYDEAFQFVMGAAGNMVYAERLKKETEQSISQDGTKEIGSLVESIRMDGVGFFYTEEKQILRDLDFAAQRGNKIALVGSSGSGKSTVARLLLRHSVPNKGAITLNNMPYEDLLQESLHAKISIVSQEPFMFSDSIRTNITLGRDWVSEQELNEACSVAQLDEWIRSLPDGIDTLVGGMGSTVSGGQKQRIVLARAILGRPEVLILDEATSALDLITERKVIEQLDAYRQEQMTIFITHRLSIIENASCIYLMDNGIIVDKGSHTQLLDTSLWYRRLVQAESEKSSETKLEFSR